MKPEIGNARHDRARKLVLRFLAGRGGAWLLLAAFAVLTLRHLLFSGTWFSNHEGVRYFVLLDEFLAAIRHGILYPRWLPDLNGGYGYPTFVYYQPGFFFWGALFRLVFPSQLLAVQLAILALFLIAGVSVYEIGRLLAGGRAALLAALIYLLTPYLYVDLFVRGDLSELYGALLLPVPFLFLCRIFAAAGALPGSRGKPGKRRAALELLLLALSSAAVISSHPAVTLFFLPLAGLAIVLLWRRTPRRTAVLFGALAGLGSGLLLAAPYWLVLAQMWRFVPHGNLIGGYFAAGLHAVYPSQFFSRTWQFGASHPGAGDSMSFQLGLPHFVLAATGFWRARRQVIVRAAFLVYLGLVLLMSEAASVLWDALPPLRYVQFPWRLLAVVAFVQIIPVLGLSRRLEAMRGAKAALVVAGIVGVAGLWYWPEFGTGGPSDLPHEPPVLQQALRTEFITFANNGEFTPLTAARIRDIPPREERPMVEAEGDATLLRQPGDDAWRIRYAASCAQEARLVLNQIYFPGWRVRVDGRVLDRATLERNLTAEGRMRVTLKPGRHLLEAWYGGPPGGAVRNVASLLLAGGTLLLGGRAIGRAQADRREAEPSYEDPREART